MDLGDSFAGLCIPQRFRMGDTRSGEKEKLDFSKVEFLTYHEGLCVQCMHIGSYDDEPATVKAMEEYAVGKIRTPP